MKLTPVRVLAMAVPLLAAGGDAAAANHACARADKPMAVGYFDHTAAWYRRQPNLDPGQMAARAWHAPASGGIIVLYSDVAATKADGAGGGTQADALRGRMQDRSKDIEDYLDAARENGTLKVRIQVPPDIVTHWADPGMRGLLDQFVKQGAAHPAAAGFYLFDEPELSGISAATLAEVAAEIRRVSPRSLLSISVASSAVSEDKPVLRAYADADPRIFDELYVNRYPVYRSYGGATAGNGAMNAKLGLSAEKSGNETLADNEFRNLGDYYDSLVAATQIPGLAGRPVLASLQAYGLREDCHGQDCKATRERKARRSPTWNELLYMYAAVWSSDMDGAVLYSRYFSLYDTALRARLDNLEALMGPVFGMPADCGAGVAVQEQSTARRQRRGTPAPVLARLTRGPGGTPAYLVVVNPAARALKARVEFDAAGAATRAEELRFDASGRPLDPAAVSLAGGNGGKRRALELELAGFAVRIFRLSAG